MTYEFKGFPPSPWEYDDQNSIGDYFQKSSVLTVQLNSQKELIQVKSSPSPSTSTKQSSNSSGQHKFGFISNGRVIHGDSLSILHSNRSKSKSRRPRVTASSQDDIADHLIAGNEYILLARFGVCDRHNVNFSGSAVSGGNINTRSRTLRKVFRNAVAYQYNETLALYRHDAGSSGQYTMQDSLSSHILGW
jgi:hypothetical protein